MVRKVLLSGLVALFAVAVPSPSPAAADPGGESRECAIHEYSCESQCAYMYGGFGFLSGGYATCMQDCKVAYTYCMAARAPSDAENAPHDTQETAEDAPEDASDTVAGSPVGGIACRNVSFGCANRPEP